MRDRLLVSPGQRPALLERNPRDDLDLPGKKEARKILDDLTDEISMWQNRLWAEQRRSVLLVLQGLDAAGKDGTIRSVFSGVNPQGCRVVSFKAPTSNERAHDYLWRIHRVCPRRGEIGIFNRSHYEDVVAVRVKELAPESVWRRRPRHICDFERLLTDEGTHLIKIYLHLSRDEQRERLQERVDNPEKRWKFNAGDLEDRKRWDQFMAAYEELLAETSTEWAPWHIVPADRNWVRNVAVAKLLLGTLKTMNPQMPSPAPGIAGTTVE